MMTELEDAIRIANAVLDKPYIDPDGDICLLARQFLRARDTLTRDAEAYDRGRRDVLNALLALNPRAAQRLHMISGGTEETFNNHAGKIPFDVVFWVAEVAEQLGIKPKDE
jgi:hypothetical protein